MPFLEIHLLCQYPPSLINRGEDGAPKSAYFGGSERQRWSSQSQKITMRRYFAEAGLVPPEHLATRTNRLPGLLTDALTALGHPDEQAADLALNTLWGANLLNTDKATMERPHANILLLLGQDEARAIAEQIHTSADELLPEAVPAHVIYIGDQEVGEDGAPAKTFSKADRKARCPKAFQDLGKSILKGLDPSHTVDLALFGRMIAQAPGSNVDGALSVAHAIGAGPLIDDLDYFTAVDDLAGPDESGSAHLGTRSLTSTTLYRYLSLNLGHLHRNLAGDDALTEIAVNACWQAAVHAQPAAMRTSTAPHTRPSLVLTILRTGQPLSLANALAIPIRATRTRDVSLGAAQAITRHWERLGQAYGHDDVVEAWHTHTFEDAAEPFPGARMPIGEHALTAAARAALHTS